MCDYFEDYKGSFRTLRKKGAEVLFFYTLGIQMLLGIHDTIENYMKYLMLAHAKPLVHINRDVHYNSRVVILVA